MNFGMKGFDFPFPDPQLLGQHRECCALRGKPGWGEGMRR